MAGWGYNTYSSAVKASRRKCPLTLTEFEKIERLLVRYIKAGQSLFTKKCKYFLEVNRLHQELLIMYEMNKGHLSQAAIAVLMCDIIVDVAQFF